MKKLLLLSALSLALVACGSATPSSPGTGTGGTSSGGTSSGGTSTGGTTNPLSVSGSWSGDFTPDDGSAKQSLKLQLTDGSNGDFTGTGSSYSGAGSYPVAGNTKTGTAVIQFLYGTTINCQGTFTGFSYKGTYTVPSGGSGTFEIYKDIR